MMTSANSALASCSPMAALYTIRRDDLREEVRAANYHIEGLRLKMKILLVEDEAPILEYETLILIRAGRRSGQRTLEP